MDYSKNYFLEKSTLLKQLSPDKTSTTALEVYQVGSDRDLG